MLSLLKLSVTATLLAVLSSAAHATVVVQPILIQQTDYDNGMGAWSGNGHSWLAYSSSNSGTDWKLQAKALGEITPPPSSAFTANAYLKIELDASWSGSTPPASIPIATYEEWEKNQTSNANAQVSFNGNSAIGSTGNTGYINDDLALDGYGEGSVIYSVGANAGGQSSVATQSGYAYGLYTYRFYP
jgi:hypothetical protein